MVNVPSDPVSTLCEAPTATGVTVTVALGIGAPAALLTVPDNVPVV